MYLYLCLCLSLSRWDTSQGWPLPLFSFCLCFCLYQDWTPFKDGLCLLLRGHVERHPGKWRAPHQPLHLRRGKKDKCTKYTNNSCTKFTNTSCKEIRKFPPLLRYLDIEHVNYGIKLWEPELPLLIAAPEHKLHIGIEQPACCRFELLHYFLIS